MGWFNVGDIVIGNQRASRYSITKTGWTGRVIKLGGHNDWGDEYIEVAYEMTKACPNPTRNESVYDTFDVKSECFDLYDEATCDESFDALDDFIAEFEK